MKRIILILGILLVVLCACRKEKTTYTSSVNIATITKTIDTSSTALLTSGEDDHMIIVKIEGKIIDVTWEDNDSVKALYGLVQNGLNKVSLSQYGGFEQVGSLGTSIPSADKQISTVPGDIMLYTSSNIVLFYGTNSWSYTRLGHINLSDEELTSLLNKASVMLELEIAK